MSKNGSRARFPRSVRLLSSKDFQHVFENPERSSDDCFTVLVRLNQLDHPRLGFAITKKIVKSAVARNRIKRITRESFRHHQEQLQGLDIVVLGRSGIDKKSKLELHNSLVKHWSRLSKQCEKS